MMSVPSTPHHPKVVLLGGGLGTRTRDETEYRPKPIADVQVDQQVRVALEEVRAGLQEVALDELYQWDCGNGRECRSGPMPRRNV